MDECKRERIIATVCLTIIEGFVANYLRRLKILNFSGFWFQFLTIVAPVGFLYFINFYLLSLPTLRIVFALLDLLGCYKRKAKRYNAYILDCANWITNLDVKWGPIASATEAENANTCEGLIALKLANLDKTFEEIYDDIWGDLLERASSQGLISKSLGFETVVCTSMLLYLCSLEKDRLNKSQKQKVDGIAKYLWEVRTKQGWGVYVEKIRQNECVNANSFWALRALNLYGYSSQREYRKLLKQIYGMSANSLFGYTNGDEPRLSTTAMAIVLYYELPSSIQQDLSKIFSVKKAISFVEKKFCKEKIEFETEILYGIDRKSKGPKKSPWNHIAVSWVSAAIVAAYFHKDINSVTLRGFLHRIDSICEDRIHYISDNGGNCYYLPKGSPTNSRDIPMYPTCYLMYGLTNLVKLSSLR